MDAGVINPTAVEYPKNQRPYDRKPRSPEARLRNETLYVAPQNLIEFWAVATRSRDDNGLGMTIASAAAEVASLRRLFRLLPSTPEVLEAWQRIVVSQRVLAEVETIVEAEPLGALRLKGFGKPVEAFAVTAAVPVGVEPS